jgi:general stress protein YciG
MANTSKRGFASMDASKQREIASKGGRAAHAKGTAHEFTSDEARVAGRKGGEAVSRDRAHMSTIGREGGHSRGARARASQDTGSSTSESTRSASNQSFDRSATSERTGYETGNRAATPQRSAFTASDRTSSSSRNERNSERSGDNQNDGPFSTRDEI